MASRNSDPGESPKKLGIYVPLPQNLGCVILLGFRVGFDLPLQFCRISSAMRYLPAKYLL
jgi:hypothetical protein